MSYSFVELTLFFFIYSILAWILMTFMISLYKGHFVNVGLLNGPILPSSGLAVTICVWLVRDTVANYAGQFFLCVVVCFITETIGKRFYENLSGYSIYGFFNEILEPLGKYKKPLRILVPGMFALLTIFLIHPFVLVLTGLLIEPVQKVLAILLGMVLLIDSIASGVVFRKLKRSRLENDVVKDLDELSNTWGEKIEANIRKRLYKAYPEMEASAAIDGGFGTPAADRIFAKDYGFIKFFWVFLLCALAGDIVETFYCRIVGGSWMSRSSFLYGPFSVVWGLGAALGIAALVPLQKKNDRWLFMGGFFLGGAYEYLCSVFTEVVFGQVFWDYSYMPLNIGGRTNVLFMFFWGIAAVILVKFLYPVLCKLIERIPPLPGLIVTWILVFIIVLDVLVTGLALGRFSVRQTNSEAITKLDSYLDTHYPDEFVANRWPNMITREKTS